MPRSAASQESQILKWFQTAPLPMASLVFGVLQATMRERRQRSEEAKARVGGGHRTAAAGPAAAPRKKAKAKAKKSHHKKRPPAADATASEVDNFSMPL